jgi:hypothetical protein
MKRYVGRSPDGARRVYGQDDYHQTALAFCKEAAVDYVKGRPDTGPLDKWTFDEATSADMWAVQFSRDC